jgi:peptidyl-Lys metalloendopeptidase
MKTGNQRSLAHHTLHWIMMFAVILSAFGAWNLPNARAQEAPTGAVVSLSIDRPSFGAGDDVIVRVGIANPTGSSIRMLKWFTPLDGLERSLFTVSRNGEPVRYVGKMVKRAAPTEKDYVTLMAGESLTSTADLSANYDLSVSGVYTVKYKVASADVYAKTDRGPSQSTDYMDSNSVELFIEGRAKPALWDVTPEVVTGTNSFVGCSSSQQTSCISARNTASNYTGNAVNYLAGSVRTVYTEWFGAYDSSRYATVQSHFNSLRSAVDTANPMTFDCSTCTNASWFAYVYAGSPYKVYLCGAFWECSRNRYRLETWSAHSRNIPLHRCGQHR